MFKIDEKVLKAYESNSREISVRATFNDTNVVTGQHIKSFTVTDSVGNTDSLSLGNTCSKKLELDMLVPENFIGINKAKIEIEIGINVDGIVEYTPLGVFYVDEYTTKNDYKSVKITAFDAMYKITEKLGDNYTCGLSRTNVTVLQVIQDICSQSGITVKIPDATNGVTDKSIRQGENVLFENGDITYESNHSIGTTNLIPIPKGTTDITIQFHGINDLSTSNVKVVYYKDYQKAVQYSSVDYSGMTFGNYYDMETGDEWIEGSITPPSYTDTLFLGFHIITEQFEDLPDARIDVLVSYPVINYVNGNVTIPNPGHVDLSARDILGYMVGILGCNAVIDRSGKLTLKKLETTSNSIPSRQQYMDGLEKAHESTLSIDYITTGSETDKNGNGGVITIGSGVYGLNFENPYITSETVAENILNLYKGIQILPCIVNYKGNPSIDCGDFVSVQDKNNEFYNVLVLNNVITVTGGLSAKIDCELKTDVKRDFISIPSSKRLENKLSGFEASYQEMVQMMSGVTGGYVKFVFDSQKKLRAIAIPDADIELKWVEESNGEGKVVATNGDNNVAMWVWCNGGEGYTKDGGKTYEVLKTKDGRAYANYLLSPGGTIGGFNIGGTTLYSEKTYNGTNYLGYIQSIFSNNPDNDVAFGTKLTTSGTSIWPFTVKYDGSLHAIKGDIAGWNITETGFKKGNNFLGQGLIESGRIHLTDEIGDAIYTIGDASIGNLYCKDIDSTGISFRNNSNYNVFCNEDGNLVLYGLNYIKSNNTFRLDFRATSGTIPLVVNTNCEITTTSSSKRYKENITVKLEKQLAPERLYDLPVVQYNYKEEHKDKELVSGTQIGITAEDVEKYYPNAVIRNAEGEAESWQDRIMIPAMLKLIQEQKKEIDTLKKNYDNVRKRLLNIENIIEDLGKGSD